MTASETVTGWLDPPETDGSTGSDASSGGAAAGGRRGPVTVAAGEELVPGYRVISHVRQGADLDTYEVYSLERYCSCFVKTVRSDRADSSSARRRLVREAKLLASFTHPHVVRAYELVEPAGGVPTLVMETLGGATLSGLLERTPRLTAPDLGLLGTQLCSAVAYLHDHHVLHLDIKPSNVICEQGLVRLIDLSLARPPGRYHRGIGTAAYMAPEQVRGGWLDTPADVWGVGLLLYEAATGSRPFDLPTEASTSGSTGTPTGSSASASTDSSTAYEQRHPQLVDRASPLRRLRRLPRPVGDVIDGCLDPSAEGRPGLLELREVLESICPTDDLVLQA